MSFTPHAFTPPQPYLERNTTYNSFRPVPGDELYGLVWEVYQVDGFDIRKSIAFPDLCADVMVLYSAREARCYFMGGTEGLRYMNDLDFLANTRTIFGVKFCTGTLGNLFQQDARDAGSCIIEARDVLIGGGEVIPMLLEARSFAERWTLFKRYLLQRLHVGYQADPLVRQVANMILAAHGNIKVHELEKATGYTARHIRQKMNDRVGISIKTLCELAKFQWSYHLYHHSGAQMSLADLAMFSGYYDQSHMNLSYKKITGLSPTDAMNLYR